MLINKFRKMPSQSKLAFEENKKDVLTLWDIHKSYAGSGKGRKTPEVEVINRSVIIIISACWEVYIEDVAKEAFEYLITHCSSPTQIPNKVKVFATKTIKEDNNPLEIWKLADDGWKTILTIHKVATIKEWVDNKRFNTPNTININKLFEELIGINKMSDSWNWKKMSKTQAAEKLEEFIKIRGEIAHRLKNLSKVRKDAGVKYINHVENLVNKTDLKIESHILDLIGSMPW